jgi:dihydroorotate dehydrogenase (fumarate)
MADLTTTYMGLTLHNPLIAASSSLTKTVEGVREFEEAGAGAVVLKSLFEEQVRIDMRESTEAMQESIIPEAIAYLQSDVASRFGTTHYLQLIDGCKKSVKIPVIASLNASSAGTWTKFASQVEAAGADAIELNIYVMPMDPSRASQDIEQTYIDILESVLEQVKIPVAVKIGPYFSNISRMVLELDRHGAASIVMFNRFFQPDMGIEKMQNRMKITLSEPHEMQLPLRWIALLSDDTKCDLCASTGVHEYRAALKQILAGANAVQLCSTLYRNKRTYIGQVASEMNAWMDEKGLESIKAIRGNLNEAKNPNPEQLARSQYIKALTGVD